MSYLDGKYKSEIIDALSNLEINLSIVFEEKQPLTKYKIDLLDNQLYYPFKINIKNNIFGLTELQELIKKYTIYPLNNVDYIYDTPYPDTHLYSQNKQFSDLVYHKLSDNIDFIVVDVMDIKKYITSFGQTIDSERGELYQFTGNHNKERGMDFKHFYINLNIDYINPSTCDKFFYIFTYRPTNSDNLNYQTIVVCSKNIFKYTILSPFKINLLASYSLSKYIHGLEYNFLTTDINHKCSICHLKSKTVVLNCNPKHYICEECFNELINYSDKCPICRQKLIPKCLEKTKK
jgi:hypothetical protein